MLKKSKMLNLAWKHSLNLDTIHITSFPTFDKLAMILRSAALSTSTSLSLNFTSLLENDLIVSIVIVSVNHQPQMSQEEADDKTFYWSCED